MERLSDGFPRSLPAETPAKYRDRLDPEQLAQVALEMPGYSSWPSPRLPSRAFELDGVDQRGARP